MAPSWEKMLDMNNVKEHTEYYGIMVFQIEYFVHLKRHP